MSGHSKWSTIKRKKAKEDAQKGKIFSKLIKEITIAARQEGGDPTGNPRLRTAIEAAKKANMPQTNIEKAIQRGTGEIEGVSYEEVVYEGYGPGGVAVITEVVTDNKNRAVADIRHIFTKHNGNLGETGSVSWGFEQKGLIVVEKDGQDEEDLMMMIIDQGADDIVEVEDAFEIMTSFEGFETVKKALEQANVNYTDAELVRSPRATVKVEGKGAQQTLRLLDALEEHDDVQRVFSNFDIDEEELETLAERAI